MQKRATGRLTIVVYLVVLVALVAVVGFTSRDVIFERFTFRVGQTVVSDSQLIYVIGGRSLDGDRYREILVVDPDCECIGKSPGLRFDLYGYAAAAISGTVLIIGGSTADGYSDAILAFDNASETITQIGSLPFSVGYGAAAVVGDIVYQIGGYDGINRRSEIVRIDPATGASSVVGELPEPRDSLAAIGHGNHILVLGGEGKDGQRLADLLEIEPQTGAVVRGVELRYALRNTSMAVSDDRLVILGTGDRGRNLMLSLDLSIPDNQRVTERSTDLDVRNSTLVAAGDRLLAIGGEHPTVSRQLGVWSVRPDSRSVEPLRFHSRIWQ